ncbi:hypothetical protein [Mycolicibacterium neworleansense]|uniref:Uncharacterized protein n=1 Tax=Mycolicibacterium neworleansense TaxID=146018 RepID=A0A0H5RWZ8_9MYCO|nr:hypothetical protein [Mycolicibacterium neworleansense]MCV7361179.1 hypothetical protein [Mycolicibacterium neworleansense]CRZ18326.1 hypothetical protein BN2156_05227 [Mycolicibacterium neworleansense]
MAATMERLDKIKRTAGVIVAAGAVALAPILGSVAVADAAPVTKVGSDPVAPAKPGGNKAPFTKVGSDPVTSAISGISGVPSLSGGAETPPLVSPWPGGAWAGHDWSKGYPGGGLANGKGGGAAIHGKAGGAWNHSD